MHKKSFFMGLSLAAAFVLGCVAAPVVLPPAQANTVVLPMLVGSSAQPWEYQCVDTSADPQSIEAEANAAGDDNWELVGAGSGSTWCFKRPRQQ